MNIEIDEEKYEQFQERLLSEIIRSTKAILEEKEVPEELIYDIAGDLSFQICSIIDSSAYMESEGEEVLPFLAFSRSPDDRNDLIAIDGGSYMHEMVYGVADEIFEMD